MTTLPSHFQLIRPLGAGAEKQTFLVEDLRSNERVVAQSVAIPADAGVFLARIHEIATIQRAARVECVAPVFEVSERGDSCWLVGEYFPGGDLGAYLAKRKARALPVADALDIASRVARALAHAHARGFVHGDVKPDNLLLDANGEVFLSDFGLVRHVGEAGGVALGTVNYMAPELQTDAQSGPATDLYALGCLLYELLTGKPPFQSSDPNEVLRRQALERARPLRLACPEAPLLLERLVEKLLAKHAKDRPASALDVRVSLLACRKGLPRVDLCEQPTVARTGERRRLVSLVELVRDGASECLSIRGAAGLGKSRLLEELRDDAERAGLLTLVATSDEQAQRPSGVLADWVRPMAAWLDEIGVHDAAVLRRLFADDAAGEPARELDLRPGVQSEVPRAFAAAIRCWSQRQPLALLLDDRQWADSDSAVAFESLSTAIARGAAELPGVLIAAAVRTDATRRDVSPLEGQPHFHDIELEPFGESEIFELLTSRGAERPTSQLVRLVANASLGNPLFADLIVERMQRSGGLETVGNRSGVGPSFAEFALPASLAEDVRETLARLSEDVRCDLALAACLGQRFAAERLAAIGGKGVGLYERLREAELAGIVQPASGGHQFRHALVWRAVYEGIDLVRREHLHQEIATYAMRQPEATLPERAFLVAHQLLRAGRLASVAELAHWTREAGSLAFQRFAWREAADLYEDALRLLSTRPNVEPALLAELHSRAGASHYFSYDSKPAIRHLTAAVEGLQPIDELGYTRALNDLVRVNAQSGAVGYGQLGELVPTLEAAVRKLSERENALRARVYMTLAEAHWTAGHAQETERYARRAVELGTLVGDERVCGEAYVVVAIARLQVCELADSLASLRTAIAHAHRHDDPYVMRFARGRMPLLLLATGRIEEACTVIRECIATDEIVVNPGDASMSRALIAYSSIVKGRFDDGDREAELALDVIRRVEFPWPRLILGPALAYANVVRRNFGTARALLREYAEPGVVFADPGLLLPSVRRLEALVDYYAGDPLPLASDDLGTDLLPADRPDARLDLLDLIGVGIHAELCDAAGVAMDPRAERILARAGEQGAVLTVSWPFSLPRARGWVALREGRLDDAEDHFDRDVELANARGSAYEMARARYERARVLVQRGTRLSCLRAAEELESALVVLRTLGPPVLAERCERLGDFAASRSR